MSTIPDAELYDVRRTLRSVAEEQAQDARRGLARSVGRRIAQIRSKRGVSSEDLGAAVGASRGTVSTWENGHALPDSFYLPLIAQTLGVRIDEIFSFTPPAAVAETELRLPEELMIALADMREAIGENRLIADRAAKAAKHAEKTAAEAKRLAEQKRSA